MSLVLPDLMWLKALAPTDAYRALIQIRGQELMTMKPISDKAEVSIDFPDKAYVGAFTRNSGFEAYADEEGVSLKLSRPGEDRRTAEVHLHYHLFADILEELAVALAARPRLDEAHRAPLLKAARELQQSLAARRPKPPHA